MRLGICHQVTLPGTWEDAIAAAGMLGVEGIELFVRDADLPALEDQSTMRRAREAAERADVAICSLCLVYLAQGPAMLTDAATRATAVELTTNAIRRCAEAGGDMVLLPVFSAAESGAAMDNLVASVRELVPTAADLGVTLGLESNMPAAEVLAVLERVGSPAVVGDYYDMGNAAGRGMDAAEEVRLRKGRIVRVHAKGVRGAAMDEGTVDLGAVGDALRETGYDGWLVLESSAGDDPIGNAERNLGTLRESFGL